MNDRYYYLLLQIKDEQNRALRVKTSAGFFPQGRFMAEGEDCYDLLKDQDCYYTLDCYTILKDQDYSLQYFGLLQHILKDQDYSLLHSAWTAIIYSRIKTTLTT